MPVSIFVDTELSDEADDVALMDKVNGNDAKANDTISGKPVALTGASAKQVKIVDPEMYESNFDDDDSIEVDHSAPPLPKIGNRGKKRGGADENDKQIAEEQKSKDSEHDEKPKPEADINEPEADINDGSSELVPTTLNGDNAKVIEKGRDWSNLPRDLLSVIAKKLGCKPYLLRFRSVCSNWRSHTQSHRDPDLPDYHPDFYEVSFSKSNFYLLTPPLHKRQEHPQNIFSPWLVKVGKDHTGNIHFWHPLLPNHSLGSFPLPVLDFDQMSAFHLADELRMNYRGRSENPLDHIGLHCGLCSYSEKTAAAMWQETPQFVHVFSPGFRIPTGVSYRFFHDMWIRYNHMDSACIDDICVYKGCPFMVEVSGCTFRMASDYNGVAEVEFDPIFCHLDDTKNYLVVSGGDLLLVQKVMRCKPRRIHRVYVHKLNLVQNRFELVRQLKDTVLFIGADSSFSVPTSQFSSTARPCIIFQGDPAPAPYYEIQVCQHPYPQPMVLLPLSEYEEYACLFWPPPEWAIVP